MKRFYLLLALLGLFFQLSAQRISQQQQQKLGTALSLISRYYVDSIQENKVIESAIVGMLESLDPHSKYLSTKTVRGFKELFSGDFEGIGVQFQIVKDTITVVRTMTGTPAEKVGVLPNDKFIQIEDTLVAGVGIENSDVLRKLRGKKGTPVNVKIKRGRQKELIDFRIIRDKIPLNSVNASYMVTDKIGYIRIDLFGAKTHQEFINALQKLKSQGMESLVVDLKRNGGGYLGTAIALADEFLTKNKLIVYSKGDKIPKRYLQSRYHKSTSRGDFEKGKLVILVDEHSASASEILAGAVQDWDRGVIVGRRSYGKGLVQKEFGFSDGSAMRVTIARYYTPTGRCVQKSYKEGLKKYQEDIKNRYENGELMHSDSVHFPDSLKYKTLLSKRTVYGGGGIMPDVFVPLDTTNFSPYYQKIVAKGIVNTEIMEYLNTDRVKLKSQYVQFDDFKKNFVVPKILIDKIIKEGEKEKIKFNKKEFSRSEKFMKIQIKAIIARALWDETAYFQIINSENNSLKKAVEILENEVKYHSILKTVKE